MSTIHLIRLAIGLDRGHMPSFIPGSKLIQGKLAENIALFSGLPVSPSTLLTQVTDVESAHLATKTSRGAVPARRAKVDILWISLSSDCAFLQGLCRQNPEQGPSLASASGFRLVEPGSRVHPLIKVTIALGQGIAHLQANVAQLPAPSGKKSVARMFLWRHTVDGGKSIVNDDPTPTGRTIITGLPLGVDVGFAIAVKDSTEISPWSAWIPSFIH